MRAAALRRGESPDKAPGADDPATSTAMDPRACVVDGRIRLSVGNGRVYDLAAIDALRISQALEHAVDDWIDIKDMELKVKEMSG